MLQATLKAVKGEVHNRCAEMIPQRTLGLPEQREDSKAILRLQILPAVTLELQLDGPSFCRCFVTSAEGTTSQQAIEQVF